MNEHARSLRDELRRQTRDAHDRVDALYGACKLDNPDDYRRFLVAQAAAWRTLEPVLDAGSAARLAALRADLATLGITEPAALAVERLPDAGALGLRYVLEGSRLGSTLLARDLRAGAPATADRAGRYLAVSADVEGWRALSATLQTAPRGEADDAAAIDDARHVFDLFERAWRATQVISVSRSCG